VATDERQVLQHLDEIGARHVVGSPADRYHRRISLTAGHFETNPPVSEALERLLSASGRWSATKVAERYEAEQPVLSENHIRA
jgi:hypothetical protein